MDFLVRAIYIRAHHVQNNLSCFLSCQFIERSQCCIHDGVVSMPRDATCTGDVTIPVMSVDPADGELLTRAILQADTNPDNSRYGAQSFVRDMLNAVGDSINYEERASTATVDMLEIPPKLR